MEIKLLISHLHQILRKSKKKCLFVYIMHPQFANVDDDTLVGLPSQRQTNAVDMVPYRTVQRKARHLKCHYIVGTCIIDQPNQPHSHTCILVDHIAGKAMLFDNSFSWDLLSRMRRIVPKSVHTMSSSCPYTYIGLNTNRPTCAYWTLAFVEYIIRRPHGSMAGFYSHVLLKGKHTLRNPNASDREAIRAYIDHYIAGMADTT